MHVSSVMMIYRHLGHSGANAFKLGFLVRYLAQEAGVLMVETRAYMAVSRDKQKLIV